MKLSEGQWRVGVTFNPSGNSQVDSMKNRVAALIDEMFEIASNRDEPGARSAAEAATAFEDACMWAVKAITKQSNE